MRLLAGIFGVACGAILVGMVARYGYKTSDNEIDGAIAAFLFAVITAGGLSGHAIAARVWGRNRLAAVVVGLISMAALIVSLSNSIGAIAGRGDTKTAERLRSVQQLKDDRAELLRLQRERDALPAFTSTTAEAVQFASEAVAAAERVAKAECARRANICRDRETEERARRDELARVVAHRANTERAAALEKDMSDVRARLAAAQPVATVNPQMTAILRIFGLPDTEAATATYYQNLATAIAADLLIVASLIVWEILGDGSPRKVAPPATQASPATPRVAVGEGAPEEFCVEVLRRKRGRRMAGEPVYAVYEAWCARRGARSLGVDEFVPRFFAACDRAKIKREVRDGTLYLADVELAA